MQIEKSIEALKKASQVFPGGVNSPVRAFKAVDGTPLFIQKAHGAYLYDVDGNHYIDYVLSWGPMILGHSQNIVIEKITEALVNGTSYGAPSPTETRLGELLQQRVPYLEKMRMVSSGTEATMSALRLARAVTKRTKVVKFDGCYHGHSDSFLVQAGSGIATFGLPNSPGVPNEVAEQTGSLPYNDEDALVNYFKEHGNMVAAVIIEAVAGNMGLVPANEAFMQTLRKVTKQYGALLIIDEVMSGFRASYQGALGIYDVEPDLICLGKVVGGGFPVAVFGGKAEYMDNVAPLGAVYQAGTLSGNPIAMTAGYYTLMQLTEEVFNEIAAKTQYLCEQLKQLAKIHNIPLQVRAVGTMFGFFFNEKAVMNFKDAQNSDHKRFAYVHQQLLQRGIYFAPSQYEANFLSAAHTQADLDKTLQAFSEIFKQIQEGELNG